MEKNKSTSRRVRVVPVETARTMFWKVVHEIEPRVLSELETALDESAIDSWSKRWNLDEDWCREFGRMLYAEATNFRLGSKGLCCC